MDQAVPACFRDVMRVQKEHRERRMCRTDVIYGGTLPFGGNVQLHWGHWVPAVLPLYLALGSLSAGGRHPLMVAV